MRAPSTNSALSQRGATSNLTATLVLVGCGRQSQGRTHAEEPPNASSLRLQNSWASEMYLRPQMIESTLIQINPLSLPCTINESRLGGLSVVHPDG
jgi:hypothetical protein